MGKTKKQKKYGDVVKKPQPLAEQITLENEATPTLRVKRIKVDNDNKYVDGTLGQSIVKQSLAQLEELNDEEFPPLGATLKRKRDTDVNVSLVKHGVKNTFRKAEKVDSDHEEDSDAESVDDEVDATPINVEKRVKDFEDFLEIDKDDLSILDHFKKEKPSHQIQLADYFRDKITEKQSEVQFIVENSSVNETTLKPETIAYCHQIGKILEKYRNGPLPKMLKTFPAMSCWEELLLNTSPESWSASAMYQITRIFISNLQAHMAQHFCTYILLPRIRDDIENYKRLNFHLYQALAKALYKPAAFFKGIVFPLCSNGDCTLREAIIISSLISNASVPVAHSAAAILKIISMDYHGSNFIFLRVLFDKKYSLPYRVIEETVKNLMKFKTTGENLPVLWHQTVLAFVQRYKNDLTKEQRKDLFKLVAFQSHHKITPLIRKELEECSQLERMDVN